MSRVVAVVTPENVRIEYELAGLASRAGAAVVDTILQALILILIICAKLVLAKFDRWPAAPWANAALGIAMFLAWYGYYVYFESVWNGQTPGKRRAGLRAIKEGGQPVDFTGSAVRNLIRVVDFLPVMYGIGAIVILFGGKNKRLGDIAAGTLVVKEIDDWNAESAPQVEYADLYEIPNIHLITPDEFEAVKRFIERLPELENSIREPLAERIAAPITERLGIPGSAYSSYCELLNCIYTICVNDRGMR